MAPDELTVRLGLKRGGSVGTVCKGGTGGSLGYCSLLRLLPTNFSHLWCCVAALLTLLSGLLLSKLPRHNCVKTETLVPKSMRGMQSRAQTHTTSVLLITNYLLMYRHLPCYPQNAPPKSALSLAIFSPYLPAIPDRHTLCNQPKQQAMRTSLNKLHVIHICAGPIDHPTRDVQSAARQTAKAPQKQYCAFTAACNTD